MDVIICTPCIPALLCETRRMSYTRERDLGHLPGDTCLSGAQVALLVPSAQTN